MSTIKTNIIQTHSDSDDLVIRTNLSERLRCTASTGLVTVPGGVSASTLITSSLVVASQKVGTFLVTPTLYPLAVSRNSGGNQGIVINVAQNDAPYGIGYGAPPGTNLSTTYLAANANYNPSAVALGFQSSSSVDTGSGFTPVLVCLNSSQNVGIGTTGPTQKLDVNGSIKANGLVLGSANITGTSTTLNVDKLVTCSIGTTVGSSSNALVTKSYADSAYASTDLTTNIFPVGSYLWCGYAEYSSIPGTLQYNTEYSSGYFHAVQEGGIFGSPVTWPGYYRWWNESTGTNQNQITPAWRKIPVPSTWRLIMKVAESETNGSVYGTALFVRVT